MEIFVDLFMLVDPRYVENNVTENIVNFAWSSIETREYTRCVELKHFEHFEGLK